MIVLEWLFSNFNKFFDSFMTNKFSWGMFRLITTPFFLVTFIYITGHNFLIAITFFLTLYKNPCLFEVVIGWEGVSCIPINTTPPKQETALIMWLMLFFIISFFSFCFFQLSHLDLKLKMVPEKESKREEVIFLIINQIYVFLKIYTMSHFFILLLGFISNFGYPIYYKIGMNAVSMGPVI